jgi:hypothetical protein
MFLGHLAIGFAAKRAAPRAGLAPLMADLPLWPGSARFGFGPWTAIACVALAQWRCVPWAALIDGHRALRDGAAVGALAA